MVLEDAFLLFMGGFDMFHVLEFKMLPFGPNLLMMSFFRSDGSSQKLVMLAGHDCSLRSYTRWVRFCFHDVY